MPFLKKFKALFLCAAILFSTSGIFVKAETTAVAVAESGGTVLEQKLDIKAKSVILMEVNTGKILYEDNPNEILPPASITKVMSLLLVIEALERGDFDLETVVCASEHACSMGGSQIWLEPNESMTVDDLLKAAVIVSANDATVALGELVAGSEEGFVALMNKRAKELGMTNTTFKNASGLDHEGHLTTAHDIAVMSSELIKHDLIKNYTTVWMDTLRDGQSELTNTNKLVRFYNGTTGLKTGTTSGSGYCLSATAERDSLELVAVVMGADTTSDRFEGAKKLLDFGFSNFAFKEITADIEKDFKVNVENGVKDKVLVKSDGSFGVLLKKSDSKEITQKTVINKNIKAPIKKGDKIGIIKIYSGDEMLGEIKLLSAENVEKLTYFKVLFRVFKGLFIL